MRTLVSGFVAILLLAGTAAGGEAANVFDSLRVGDWAHREMVMSGAPMPGAAEIPEAPTEPLNLGCSIFLRVVAKTGEAVTLRVFSWSPPDPDNEWQVAEFEIAKDDRDNELREWFPVSADAVLDDMMTAFMAEGAEGIHELAERDKSVKFAERRENGEEAVEVGGVKLACGVAEWSVRLEQDGQAANFDAKAAVAPELPWRLVDLTIKGEVCGNEFLLTKRLIAFGNEETAPFPMSAEMENALKKSGLP